MKKFILPVIAALPLASIAQDGAKINGALKNVKDTIPFVYFTYSNEGNRVMDSAAVTNNQYVYTANIHEPTFIYIAGKSPRVRSSARYIASVFIEPGKVNIVSIDSFSNVKVSGSKTNVEYEQLTKAIKPYDKQMSEAIKAYSKHKESNEEALMKADEKRYDSIEEKRKSAFGDYVKSNTTSSVALYALQQYVGYGSMNTKEIEPLFDKLSATTKSSYSGKAFAKRIDAAKATGIGSIAPDFTQNDTLNNPISLASFKGKYVLLDFWASWCGPCREENPNVVAAFNKYKDKNFTILSVSLDREGQKDKWLAAIHHDGLAWTHVSDLKWWNNAVAKSYGIQSIPQNFLLDPSGKIIGKDLRGEELEKKLKEVLN